MTHDAGEPPPPWVDLSQEVTDTSDRDIKPEHFIHMALVTLVALGFDRERAIEVIAHCATECSWGRRAIGDNAGGVKLKRDDDALHRALYDHGLGWWRAPGHVASGDPPWVYYRTFDSPEAFWRFWLARYVPRPGKPPEKERYAATGVAFWGADPPRWFVELLCAGYRGPVREREIKELLAKSNDPETHPSVKRHRATVEQVRAVVSRATP